MARRGIRKQDGEDLSEATIDKVIKALEADKPITKKAACEMLSISYNTTRLNSIIQNHKDTMEFRAKMRKKMRGQPIDTATASDIVSSYLSGDSLVNISNRSHRSTNVVKRVLTKYNVPIRNSSVDYWHPVDIPLEAVADDYEVGDLVYAARYDLPATIIRCKNTDKYGMVYAIQLHSLHRKQAYQPHFELADLRRVQKELGLKMQDLDDTEVRVLINEGLKSQKRQEDKRR